MITIPFTSENQYKLRVYFTETIGGCYNHPSKWHGAVWPYVGEKFKAGRLERMYGLSGYDPEKEVTWTIAEGTGGLYVETAPDSYETMILLMFG